MRTLDRLAISILGAAALAAMAFAHALELWLESWHVLGDAPASYTHPAQVFAVEIACAILLVALACIIMRLLRGTVRAVGPDPLVPALDSLVRFGLIRTSAMLVLSQLGILIVVELLEQRLSGFNGGVADVIGAGHVTAIAVNLLISALFAFVLYRVARLVCAQSCAIAGAIAMFLRRSLPFRRSAVFSHQLFHLWICDRKPPLLALGLANRPPPMSSTSAA